MGMRCLSPQDGGASARVTIPKNLLALDDLLDEDGLVEGQSVHVQRHSRGRYTVNVLDERSDHLRRLIPTDRRISGQVTIPKDDLVLDGLVDDEGAVEKHPVMVTRTGRCTYEVVVLDDDLQPIDGGTDDDHADEA